MNKIKKLGLVLVFLFIILVLVIVRSTNPNLFKKETKVAVESAGQGKNVISIPAFKELRSDFYLITLDDSKYTNLPQFKNAIHIPFENILDKKNRKILKKASAEIMLYSKDISTSSKAWVILNQLGFENLRILQNEENIDVFKYEFQPDTTARLE